MYTCISNITFLYFVTYIRHNLSDYYVADFEKDFICSQSDDSGMTKCTDIPPSVFGGGRCNGSLPLDGSEFDESISGTCINWNQYYSDCRPVGSNPFHGAISFDNIGLAWVAIFQVSCNYKLSCQICSLLSLSEKKQFSR